MKNKFVLIVFYFISISLFFVLGMLYFQYINKKFYSSNEGIELSRNRVIWGNPDKINIIENEIIETYYPILPLNEYKFFFSKKDSLLIRKWKEY
jgi:cell division septal protein FtsQ